MCWAVCAGHSFPGGREHVIFVVLEKNLRGMPSLDNCLDLCDSLYLLDGARLTLDSNFDSSGTFYSVQQSFRVSVFPRMHGTPSSPFSEPEKGEFR